MYIVEHTVKAYELSDGVWRLIPNFPNLGDNVPHTQIRDQAIKAVLTLK